jgi:hypothetical protein
MSTEMQTKVQASPAQSFTPVQTGLLQRKSALCNTRGLVEDSERDKEKLTLQRSSVYQAGTTPMSRFGHDFSRVSVHSTGPGIIQTKLKINEPGDLYEQEADRVADAVMRIPAVQRQTEEELVQTKPVITTLVPRPSEGEEEELFHTKELLGQSPEVKPALSSSIQSLKGGGQPLSKNDRTFFEPRLGYVFSSVRVHTDTRAAETTRAVNAQAFTLGQDVVFGVGQYSPFTTEGRQLIAHELTHVVQQAGAEGIIQRGARHVKLTPTEKFEWDIGLLSSEIEDFKKLSTEARLSRIDFILRNLRRIESNPLFADVDIKVKHDIQAHIVTFESTLSAFGQAQRQNVRTVKESGFSWAAVGWIAVMDGPQPGVMDLFAAFFALGMVLFVSHKITTITLDPNLRQRQAEDLAKLLKILNDSVARLKPTPMPKPSETPVPRPAPEEIPVPGQPDKVIPISSHPKYQPHFPPTLKSPKIDPVYLPVPKPKPEPEEKERLCREIPIGYHRGGDSIHNTCADFHPRIDNFFKGSDYLVETQQGIIKLFDAISLDGTLWEVKTETGSTANSSFLRSITIDDYKRVAKEEKAIANACRHPFKFAIADTRLYQEALPELTALGVPVIHVPECLRGPKE